MEFSKRKYILRPLLKKKWHYQLCPQKRIGCILIYKLIVLLLLLAARKSGKGGKGEVSAQVLFHPILKAHVSLP